MNTSRIILLTLLVICAPSCEMPSVFSTPVEVASTFIEPVTLASEAGVLEVNLFARQGTASLDTVSGPVHNFLLFSYEVLRGSASNGKKSDTNLYPGPTLLVQPGETLSVHLQPERASSGSQLERVCWMLGHPGLYSDHDLAGFFDVIQGSGLG